MSNNKKTHINNIKNDYATTYRYMYIKIRLTSISASAVANSILAKSDATSFTRALPVLTPWTNPVEDT